ncbi:MAG TPA: hypothetical protein VNO26_16175 [Candidatus Limnocylindria bacterium]|nr:hypothetical protein [Candidatus Limnocylindria bacterium]
MNSLRIGLSLLALAALGGTPARADTVSGEVVDLSCYLHHPATSRGATHRKCAETCAKKGLPMGLLTDDGSVVLLLEDHANPKAYATAIGKAADTITVEGTKVTQGGLTGVVVEAVK